MEELKTRASPRLAALLTPVAPQINQLYEAKRGPQGSLDPQAFTHWFLTFAEPLADRILSARVAEIADAVLELMSRDLLGNEGKYPRQTAALAQFCGSFALAYSEDPRKFLFAFWNLGQKAPLTDLVETCGDQGLSLGLSGLMDLGVVLAWTRGQCFYREAALEIVSRGERAGFRALLRGKAPGPENWGAASSNPSKLESLSWQEIVETLHKKPWLIPGDSKAEFFRFTGGFRGYGQFFSAPPLLVEGPETPLTVSSGNEFWGIRGDAYGLGLLRAAQAEKLKQVQCEVPDLVNRKMESLGFPISEVTSSAWLDQVLVWTSQHSYKVYFLTF